MITSSGAPGSTGGLGGIDGPGGGGRGWGGIPVGWGKFCGDELAVALAISKWAGERMLALAHDLAVRLPGTARALHEGVIDGYKAQIIAEATRVLDDAGAAVAESLALPAIAGLAARINLTIPLATLLGLADHPGEAGGFGPVDAGLARAMATAAATNPATTWCVTVTDAHGHSTAHGCAQPTRRTRPRHKTGPGTGPPGGRTGPSGGYGTWRLRPAAGGPDLIVDLEPIAVTDCDHRHETAAHDPSDKLRHLVQIRDGECTWPPCRRTARRCDFEHAIPWEQGGRTCACNAGPRCRRHHHHHLKQAPGWRLDQHQPGYHTWTTPAGRQYTTGPTTYPT